MDFVKKKLVLWQKKKNINLKSAAFEGKHKIAAVYTRFRYGAHQTTEPITHMFATIVTSEGTNMFTKYTNILIQNQ